ncbi:hypothetical protein FSP39_023242 [Pinctada imbricata]|uniref:SRCR domain-containing protein n=1 Tax=Pinctada imbricata TaxID=66713 RepID=A0AA88XNJ7_PINIB|nr:hypothetical protein FSP39_023242 [Pinctada imbricata]
MRLYKTVDWSSTKPSVRLVTLGSYPRMKETCCYLVGMFEIRLRGGLSNTLGRVEVNLNDGYGWGTVCDDAWDVDDAKVACRSLGLPYKFAIPVSNAGFGEGTGRIHMDDVSCTGSESSLRYCTYVNRTKENCYHREDAGVVCWVSTFYSDFSIIQDRQLRGLLKKGPKYRIPSKIDFIKCREVLKEALDNYTKRWCKSEGVESHSLNDWKNLILDITDIRIDNFHKNPHLFENPSSRSERYFKSKLRNLQEKFVFAPADKAANNTIII